ncbi:MAG: hypothetical protein ACLQU4_13595 [Limisphaerales bacterium]
MRKIIDIAEIESREKALVEELAKLRAIKKYAIKFGADYGVPPPRRPQPDVVNISAPRPIEPQADVEAAVRTTIATFGQQYFHFNSIEALLVQSSHTFSRSSVFEALATLKANGEIKPTVPGAGRRPTQYQITEKFKRPTNLPDLTL